MRPDADESGKFSMSQTPAPLSIIRLPGIYKFSYRHGTSIELL